MSSWKLSLCISDLCANADPTLLNSLLEMSIPPLTAFVAIGVPVSFGVLKSYAERYRTQYLVEYVNRMGPISAQRILGATAFYLVFLTVLMLLGPESTEFAKHEGMWKTSALILLLFYCVMIIVTAIWYIRLFRRVSLSPSELIANLKRSSVSDDTQSRSGYNLALYLANTDSGNFFARLSILREGFRTDNADVELIETFTSLRGEVQSLLFCQKSKTFLEIDNGIINILSAFCNTSRIVLNEIKAGNRDPWFSIQRELFTLYTYIFNHPSYDERFAYQFFPTEDVNTFSIAHHIYDIAEWQNFNPSLSGNLFAEAEWLPSVLKKYERTWEFNPSGMQEAFKLWRDISLLSIRMRPERLTRLFEQLRSASLFNTPTEITIHAFQPTPAWFDEWQDKFSKLEPNLKNLPMRKAAKAALNGECLDESWKSIARRAKQQPAQLIGSLTVKSLEDESIVYEGLRCLFFLFSGLARYQRWDELKQIWYNTQPSESDSEWVGSHDILNRKAENFCEFTAMSSKWEMYLEERILCKKHFSQAAIFLFRTMSESEDAGEIRFPSNSIKICDGAYNWLERAFQSTPILSSKPVLKHFDMKRNHAKKYQKDLENIFKEELQRVKDIRHTLLCACFPDPERYLTDKLNLKKMWQKTNDEFWIQIDVYDLFKINPTTSVGDMVHVTVPGDESHKYTPRSQKFITGMEFGGRRIAKDVIFHALALIAGRAQRSSTAIVPGTIWILPEAELNKDAPDLFIQRLVGITPHKQDKFFWAFEGTGIAAMLPNSVELHIHEWNSNLAPILHQYATKSTFCTVIQVPVVVYPRVQFVTIRLDVIWRPQYPPTAQSPLDHAASMALRDDCTVGGPYDSPSSRQLVQYWG